MIGRAEKRPRMAWQTTAGRLDSAGAFAQLNAAIFLLIPRTILADPFCRVPFIPFFPPRAHPIACDLNVSFDSEGRSMSRKTQQYDPSFRDLPTSILEVNDLSTSTNLGRSLINRN